MRHRYYDPYILEYVLEPRFWILATFLAAFWIWTIAASFWYHPPQASGVAKRTASPGTKDDTSRNHNKPDTRRATYSPRYILWLEPHLKSPLQKIIVIFIYLGILLMQLLEGYWIVITFTRMDMRVFHNAWHISAPIWVYGVYAFSLIISIGIEMSILGLLGIMVLFHVTCIAELAII